MVDVKSDWRNYQRGVRAVGNHRQEVDLSTGWKGMAPNLKTELNWKVGEEEEGYC